MAAEVNVENVDWSQVDGTPVGIEGARVVCDLTNRMLGPGDDVRMLAAAYPDGRISLSWVCAPDADLAPSAEDEQRGKVVLTGRVVRRTKRSEQLVVTDTERVVPDG